MTAFEYTAMAAGKGLIFALMVTLFVCLVRHWWHARNMSNLHRNTVDALFDVENKIECHRLGVLILTSQQALDLYKERRYLTKLVHEYETANGQKDQNYAL